MLPGLVHRDLKPSNVLLAEDGPRVIDFGISRAVEATSLTRSGFVVGSPGFMSPEQAEGGEVGPPSDIFSLGSVLAFAATGQGPFGTGSTAALVYRVVHGSPNLDRLSAELRPLIEHCLAKDPGQRPTAADLLAQVGAIQPAPGWLPEPISRELALHAAAGTAPASDAAADRSAVQVPTENSQVPAQAPDPSATVTAQKPQPPVVAPDRPYPSGDDGGRRRSRRSLVVAAVIGGLTVASAVAITLSTTGGTASPPSRLVSITLSPTTPASTDVLAVAAQLLRQRAARLHLPSTQARVSGQTIVQTGPAADEAQLKALAVASVLNFRQVLLYEPYGSTTPTAVPSPSPTLSPSASPAPSATNTAKTSAKIVPDVAASATPSPSASATSSPKASATASPSPSATSSPTTSSSAYGDASLVNKSTLALFNKLTCKPGNTQAWKNQVGYTNSYDYDNPNVQIVACGQDYLGAQLVWGKFALDVAKVQGNWVTSAIAALSTTSNEWQVNLTLNSQGTSAFSTLTSHLYDTYYTSAQAGDSDDFYLDQVAIALDGNVVSSPEIDSAIPGGNAQITGDFTRIQAEELAAQLQSGALPVDFRVSAISTFSPSPSS